ncbi:uncharacterized protein [Ptychodera flava]|uniref:uncharacterized protein n=1 Tax=Ptychodera flava TaxID=63121 RepID=UPI00396A6D49
MAVLQVTSVYLSTRFLIVSLVVRLGSSAYIHDRYGLYPGCETWHGAVAVCMEKGGRLATIPDNTTHSLLINLIKEQGLEQVSFWFNAHDTGTEGHWDTFEGEAVKYFGWAPGEPNNNIGRRSRCRGNQDCAKLWKEKSFQFDDDYCCNLYGYICDFHVQESETTLTSSKSARLTEVSKGYGDKNQADYLPTPARNDRYSQPDAEIKSSDTADRVQLVLVILIFLLLIAIVLFGSYYYVSRKIKRVAINEPRYEDLVNDQSKDDVIN